MDIANKLNLELSHQMKSLRIFVAGHNGLVGRAIFDSLISNGFTDIVIAEKSQLNLLNQSEVISSLSLTNSTFPFGMLASEKKWRTCKILK